MREVKIQSGREKSVFLTSKLKNMHPEKISSFVIVACLFVFFHNHTPVTVFQRDEETGTVVFTSEIVVSKTRADRK